MRPIARTGFLLAVFVVMLCTKVHAQATVFQTLTLRESVTGSGSAGRDGFMQAYIFPGSPYPFGNLGAAFSVGAVCAVSQTGEGGVWLSAGQGFGDMVAFTPGGSPFPAGQADPRGRTELCNPQDTDETWWFAYGNSLNISPLLVGRFFGNDDELQVPSCSSVPTPEEGILFLERRSADRQGSDLSCSNRDPAYPLRVGTVLLCSFTNTWLDGAGNNIQPVLESCERYLACSNVPFGGNVPRGGLCAQGTAGMTPPVTPSVVQCSTQQFAGGNTPETRQVELAQTSGTFQFDFETFLVKDQILVRYEGQTLLDTGCVGTGARQQLAFSGSSTRISVEVIPNCAGESGTAWRWTAHCPAHAGLSGFVGTWNGTFRRDDTGQTGPVVTVFTEQNGQLGGWHFQQSWVMENVAVSGNTVTFSHVYNLDCRAHHTFTVVNFETRQAQSQYTVTCPGPGGHTGTVTYGQ
jgi:hypothetical protein